MLLFSKLRELFNFSPKIKIRNFVGKQAVSDAVAAAAVAAIFACIFLTAYVIEISSAVKFVHHIAYEDC